MTDDSVPPDVAGSERSSAEVEARSADRDPSFDQGHYESTPYCTLGCKAPYCNYQWSDGTCPGGGLGWLAGAHRIVPKG
jgi:hypothetical protein